MKKEYYLGLIIVAVLAAGWLIYNSRDQVEPEWDRPMKPVVKDEPVSGYTVKDIRKTNAKIADIGLTPDNFPALDGATASQPIRSLIGCAAFGGDCSYWYETPTREMFLDPIFYKTGLTDEDQVKINSKIQQNSKTHDAYMKLIGKGIDLILVSTPPSAEELKVAKDSGVKIELTPIGLDGFVFLVNEKNSIPNLNTADLIDIYAGKAKNWKPYSGVNAPIKPFVREANSGSQELMEHLVMKEIPIDKNLAEESVIISMTNLIKGVEEEENSIGYSLFYYKNNMIDKRDLRPGVRLIAVDGIEPTAQSIASKTYPYVFNIFAATRLDEPKDSKAYLIKEWLTGLEGQELIAKAGYVKLSE
jgi:phosphate transport system substrate-binding protein